MTIAYPTTSLIQQARQGIARRRVDEVARLVGLTDKEMARVLDMSVRGLHGKAATELLSLAASERLLLLEQLLQHGLRVFDGRADLLSRWLRTPLAELAYREGANGPENVPAKPLQELGTFAEPPISYQPNRQQTASTGTLVPQSPLAVLDAVSGFSLAEDVLGRIEWGIAG